MSWLISATIMLNLFLGQSVFATPEIPEYEIPIEPIISEEKVDKNFYTEDLWEVTDDGAIDGEGYYIDSEDIDKYDDYHDAIVETQDLASNKEDSDNSVEEIQILSNQPNESFEEYRQSIIDNWGGKKAFTQKRLDGIKDNLNGQIERFAKLEKTIALAEKKLEPLQKHVETLEGQVVLLNTQILVAKEKITTVEVQIAKKRIEIKDIMLSKKKSEIEVDIQKEIVMDYVRLLYAEEEQYFDLYSEGGSTLKLLLADNSVSENLLGHEYLEVMEKAGRQVFYDLELKHRNLKEKEIALQEETEDLEYLYKALIREKTILQQNRLAKKDILDKAKGEEEKYQLLVEESIQQQLESALAIQNLRDNVQMIESKLAILDDGLEEVQNSTVTEDVIEETEGDIEIIESVESVEYVESVEPIEEQSTPFIWPVPANKITAEFHDPTYPKRWGPHQAIDIRARQFTEIIAPANGYVFQTKDNGMGYSYIILAHKNNLVTVYGHIAKIIAEAGTIVRKGDIIGLSGGTPGTSGAGLQTTGPHLHFEVHHKGESVNPLDYLPLEELPIEYVPDDYLSELK